LFNTGDEFWLKAFVNFANVSLKTKISTIPKKPGIYQFFDEAGELLYIGKAIVLKNRVSSYFNQSNQHNGKTRMLVSRIADVKFIVTDNEYDALLLENNLIKKYQPRYNVMLKDDKTYPWICVKNERFPRVFATRQKIDDGSRYFGPYASAKSMHMVLEIVKQLYPLRTCAYLLSEENVRVMRYRICLEYHIGNCLGPCEGKQSEEEYNLSIEAVINILKGDAQSVAGQLKQAMKECAESLQFEKAQEIKEKLLALEKFKSKSTVVSPTIHNVDCFTLVSDKNTGYVNFLKVANGAIIQGHTLEIKKRMDESHEELLEIGITEIRQRFQSTSTEILVPFKPGFEIPGIKFVVPQRGDKKQLLELSERNAKYYMLDQHRQERFTNPEKFANRVLDQIKLDLRLKELPVHIECFDNSNIQGTNSVAACVVFKDGKPSKKDYRHFNIKTVIGPDDFASMREVVYRRYRRMIDEGESLPQLIVIDGGKGQLSAAVESLDQLGLIGRLAIIGIAKRLEEIYYPDDPVPLYLNKTSESLKVIQHLRNEAHRFGITHHRNLRSKAALGSSLTDIDGVGKATAQKLLTQFKSVKRLSEADEAEIAKVIGAKKAKMLKEVLSKMA
jgi:excinuclease ABC subunit C